ncbi:hypothetical protein SODALDRAFT_357692 [Sodiomyces alkalinus F11]|uniref:Uncharacterized protein n=1 Tax=Sodiomyces alkalinus (strain CBS 110278 / VKM F-3762 / F11) TaxID=1314773 RepID=A0A3N2Q4D9_SODAK|nr:hypothetical protein SODALDRAFT_357692 [Sodiomyces alkalinus F11]ROT41629.1 hypothetical protein SODALDRAFT_357692 [Sodiomyces alkalinus F11]
MPSPSWRYEDLGDQAARNTGKKRNRVVLGAQSWACLQSLICLVGAGIVSGNVVGGGGEKRGGRVDRNEAASKDYTSAPNAGETGETRGSARASSDKEKRREQSDVIFGGSWDGISFVFSFGGKLYFRTILRIEEAWRLRAKKGQANEKVLVAQGCGDAPRDLPSLPSPGRLTSRLGLSG